MKRSYDVVAETAPTGPATAFLTVTKVVREHVPLHVRKGYGETIGQMIDSHIATCLENGDEVQTVAIGFDEGMWNAMRSSQ